MNRTEVNKLMMILNEGMNANERAALEEFLPRLKEFTWTEMQFRFGEIVSAKYPECRCRFLNHFKTFYLCLFQYDDFYDHNIGETIVQIPYDEQNNRPHHDEVIEWIVNNVTGPWCIEKRNWPREFIFQNEKDAFTFKMFYG